VNPEPNKKQYPEEKSFEWHIPFHNYAGPGTHINERINKGDKPINDLDKASMIHDIDYLNPYITKEQADKQFVDNLKRHGHPILGAIAKLAFKIGNGLASDGKDYEKYIELKNKAPRYPGFYHTPYNVKQIRSSIQ